MGKPKLKTSSPYLALLFAFVGYSYYWVKKRLRNFEEQSRISNLNTIKVIEQMRQEREDQLLRLLSVEHEDDEYKSPN